MGAGDISGGASLWRPATSRHIAPSVKDPVDFFVTHFQRPSRRDIAPSVNATLWLKITDILYISNKPTSMDNCYTIPYIRNLS